MEVGDPQLPAGIPTHGTQVTLHTLGLTPTGLSPSTASRSRELRLHPSGAYGGHLQLHIPSEFPQRVRFGLCRFPSPVLTASRLISFPAGTEMFHFPAFPIPKGIDAVSAASGFPFGHPRFYGCVRLAEAYRSLPRPSSAPEPSHPPGGILPDHPAQTLVFAQNLRQMIQLGL